jgi:hypothetical protein
MILKNSLIIVGQTTPEHIPQLVGFFLRQLGKREQSEAVMD